MRASSLSFSQPLPSKPRNSLSRAMCRSQTFKIAPRTPRRIISMPARGMFRRIVLAEDSMKIRLSANP